MMKQYNQSNPCNISVFNLERDLSNYEYVQKVLCELFHWKIVNSKTILNGCLLQKVSLCFIHLKLLLLLPKGPFINDVL